MSIFHELIDARGEMARKFFGIGRFERALFHLLERNEETGLAIDHDFFDSTDRARDDRGLARHCFEVDDAEWLVD